MKRPPYSEPGGHHGPVKRIAILGATGSIGVNALKVLARLGKGYKVVGLAANRDHARLAAQARRFGVPHLALSDPAAAARLRRTLPRVRVEEGPDAARRLAANCGADLVVSAMVGAAGLTPTLAALRSGAHVALANKEVLVMAGPVVMREAARRRRAVIPVDSEHSAIFQCLGDRPTTDGVRRILLTASGGPFYDTPRSALNRVTVRQALSHPTWRMGRKITIDSATLMNKGFEVIEAACLFGVPVSRIDIVVHRQSIVHSLVEFLDGSLLAQLGPTDMRLPIQYALTHPARVATALKPLDLARIGHLDFAQPDFRKFPCLRLAYEAAETGGSLPAALNAADEVAVAAFLGGRLRFTDIPRVISRVMARHRVRRMGHETDALEADLSARAHAMKEVART